MKQVRPFLVFLILSGVFLSGYQAYFGQLYPHTTKESKKTNDADDDSSTQVVVEQLVAVSTPAVFLLSPDVSFPIVIPTVFFILLSVVFVSYVTRLGYLHNLFQTSICKNAP